LSRRDFTIVASLGNFGLQVVQRIDLEWCEHNGQRWLDFKVTFVNGVAHKALVDLKTGELTGLGFDVNQE
jgi:hypothetical protein